MGSIDFIDEVGREWAHASRYRVLEQENAILRKRVEEWTFVPDENGGHMLSVPTGDKWYPESFLLARAEGAMLADQELYKRGLQVGEERERWECHEAVRRALEQIPDEAALLDGLNAISARGPMRGPKEE